MNFKTYITTTASPFFYKVDDNYPIIEIIYEGIKIKLFPPFTSSDNAFLPYPTIELGRIPLFTQRNVNSIKLLEMVIWPVFDENDTFKSIKGLTSPKSINGNIGLCDALRVDIDSSNNINFDNVAMAFINDLALVLRDQTYQWWLNIGFIGGGSIYHTYNFDSDSYGHYAGNFKSHSQMFYNSGLPIKLVDGNCWCNSIKYLAQGNKIPQYKIFWFESMYQIGLGQFNQAVINLALACEIAKEQFYKLSNNIGPYKRGKAGLKGWNLPDHLDAPIKRYKEYSFNETNPDDWEKISLLWSFRGKIAHGDQPIVFNNNIQYNLDVNICNEFSHSALRLFDYLFG